MSGELESVAMLLSDVASVSDDGGVGSVLSDEDSVVSELESGETAELSLVSLLAVVVASDDPSEELSEEGSD